MFEVAEDGRSPVYSSSEVELMLASDDEFVRADLASAGYALDKLVDDKSPLVRSCVAEHGFGVEKLMYDDDPLVREVLAQSGYALDVLMYDESDAVRYAVASRGYGLDVLIDDEDWMVRGQVAKHAYGLDTLVHDPSPNVRWQVAVVCRRHAGEEEFEKYLDVLADDPAILVREELARQGYAPEKLAADEAWQVRRAVAESGHCLNTLVRDVIPEVREQVAKQGYGLEMLVDDENEWVRREVARQGYGLDVLVNDPADSVASAALHRLGYNSEKEAEDGVEQNTPGKEKGVETQPGEEKGIEGHESGLVGIAEDALVMEVPDGYLVAEKAGAPDEYPGISLSFYSREGEFMSDIALVEHTATDWAFPEPTYVLRAWKFGEECCMEEPVLGFNGRDVAALGTKIEAAKAPAAREPGVLKSAADKPKQVKVEAATPGRDEVAAKKSAGDRGIEGPAREVGRKR